MSNLRPDIEELPVYSSARSEFAGNATISLDANENPFSKIGRLNRYPDGQYCELKRLLAAPAGVSTENLFLGSGSDECIDVLLKATTVPGRGSIVVFPPTYSMYEVQARILGLTCKEWKREEDFSIDVGRFIGANIRANVLFICSPNNPTGNTISIQDIRTLLAAFPKSIVVVDEAYIEFSDTTTFAPLIAEYPNLAIVRTLSKSAGLAGLRVGYLLASRPIIEACNKVRLPYNVSSVADRLARRYLKNSEKTTKQISIIKEQRGVLAEELSKNSLVKKVFPSNGNFLLVLVEDAQWCKSELMRFGIVVRDRSGDYRCKDCLRITIGTPDENKQLLESFRQIANRYSKIERSFVSNPKGMESVDTPIPIVFNQDVLISSQPNRDGLYTLNSGVLKSLFLINDERKFPLFICVKENREEGSNCTRSFKESMKSLLSILSSQGIELTSLDLQCRQPNVENYLIVSLTENLNNILRNNSNSSIDSQLISITNQYGKCVYQGENLYEVLLYITRITPDILIERKTKETEIRCSLNLWGNGEVQVSTGIGFFDHMLCQMGFYGKLRLKIEALGDLEIDEHHTIEDVALALGSAFDKALGSRGGIRRYGFSVPMDEAICSSVIDFSGRSELVWNAEFKRERIGDMPTEMIKHFFKSFTNTAKATLHISASGENEHHIAESIFKAFGQSLRGALRFDPLAAIPSTKGVL